MLVSCVQPVLGRPLFLWNYGLMYQCEMSGTAHLNLGGQPCTVLAWNVGHMDTSRQPEIYIVGILWVWCRHVVMPILGPHHTTEWSKSRCGLPYWLVWMAPYGPTVDEWDMLVCPQRLDMSTKGAYFLGNRFSRHALLDLGTFRDYVPKYALTGFISCSADSIYALQVYNSVLNEWIEFAT